jgi:3-deoxy-D-manno-octulosonic-acid transferase
MAWRAWPELLRPTTCTFVSSVSGATKNPLPRPPGPLVWVHGASVGEMLAVIPLIERIRALDFAVLVTSGTVTSAALAEQRLPQGALHQFIPLDAPRFVARFLDHWRPDLALFVESDLWPNLILACTDRTVPMILVNGRLSKRSFSRWRLLPGTIAALLTRFDLCLTQSSADTQRYASLGAPRISRVGNLKLDAPAPPVDEQTFGQLKSLVGSRAEEPLNRCGGANDRAGECEGGPG